MVFLFSLKNFERVNTFIKVLPGTKGEIWERKGEQHFFKRFLTNFCDF